MDATPPRSKLSYKSVKTELKKGSDLSGSSQSSSHSPKANTKSDQDDYSPIYFPTTQESNEDIDVLWDWHSPQTTGERRRRKQKRLVPVHSPHFPIKRQPSGNKVQNFEKLREELKLLQEELAVPHDESCLCISPQQEADFKYDDNFSQLNSPLEKEQEQQFIDSSDVFNDSIDEQLVLFSQQIENELLEKDKADDKEKNSSIFVCDDNSDIDNIINKYSNKKSAQPNNEPNEKVFGASASSCHTNDKKTDKHSNKNSRIPFQRTLSDDCCNKSTRNVIQTISGKLELHRTKSFELANSSSQVNIPKSKLEEIERKRLEALAKLSLKKKLDSNKNNTTQISSQKCLLEEIERKRLQALAKREAKRLEEFVEKKRQEALKRLQANRLKNANLVKRTLTTRL